MDVVVANVPPKYGMLLSRYWGAKLQGTIQMDGSYATIPIFGQLRKLYREAQMKFLVSSPEKPENSPIYSLHTDLDSFIFCNDESLEGSESQNRDTSGEAEAMEFNIMAALDLEGNEEENCNETCRICGGDLTPTEQETHRKQPSG